MYILFVRSVVSPSTPVSATNKADCHSIIEILLKVALSAITLTHVYILKSKTLLFCNDAASNLPMVVQKVRCTSIKLVKH